MVLAPHTDPTQATYLPERRLIALLGSHQLESITRAAGSAFQLLTYCLRTITLRALLPSTAERWNQQTMF